MKLTEEERFQLMTLEYFEVVLPGALCWHTPNGGRRSIGEGHKFKMLGLLPGVADLTVLPGNGEVMFFELKAARGSLSPEQRWFGEAVQHLGCRWACVRNLDDIRAALRLWSIATRESPRG